VEPGNLSAKPGIFGAQKAGIETITGNYPGIVNESCHGWPADLPDAEALARLMALTLEGATADR
jgi:hypothetical protein